MNVRNKIIAMSAVAALLGASVAHAAVTMRAPTETVETVAPRVTTQAPTAQARVNAALSAAGVNVIQLNTNSSLVKALSNPAESADAEKILTALKDPAQKADVKAMLERGQSVKQIAGSLQNYFAVTQDNFIDRHGVEILSQDNDASKNLKAILDQAVAATNAAHVQNINQAAEKFVQALGPASSAILGVNRACEVFGEGSVNPACNDNKSCEKCMGVVQPQIATMAAQAYCNDNGQKAAVAN